MADYNAKANLITKVLDFVQLGGPGWVRTNDLNVVWTYQFCLWPDAILQTFCKRARQAPTIPQRVPRAFQIRFLSPESPTAPQKPFTSVYETAALPLSYTGLAPMLG